MTRPPNPAPASRQSRRLDRSARVGQALCAVWLATLAASATAADSHKHAWTQAAVSSGLHSLNHAATVLYRPAAAVPPGALITAVYADRDYFGQADVQTSLCWNGRERCVDITGRSINTRVFKGLDARQPMYLVHRARAWHGSHRPLFVRGTVTVWYQLEGAPKARP